MVAGFSAGLLTDKIGGRNMIILGPLISMSGIACLLVMTQYTSDAYIGELITPCVYTFV